MMMIIVAIRFSNHGGDEKGQHDKIVYWFQEA